MKAEEVKPSVYPHHDLYLAQHPDCEPGTARLFSTRVLNYLIANDFVKNSSVEAVIADLKYIDSRKSMWTTDMDEADTWSYETIKMYAKYLPGVDFCLVRLTTRTILGTTK